MKEVKKNTYKNTRKSIENKFIEDKFVIFILIPILFLIPFSFSFFFTKNYLERKTPVSIQEESQNLVYSVDSQDLNDLYIKSENKKKDGVIVLAYHQIRDVEYSDDYKTRLFITSTEIFEKEMKYLYDNGYTSISFTDYINYLKDKTKNPIPKKSVIISFDDGYITQYTNAFPILKKYNLKATFFIYMGCIDIFPACMNSENLKELISNKMFLANHTLNHIYLPNYKDRTIIKEIENNQNILQEKFGFQNIEKVLAYPYGGQDSRIKNILNNLGYIGGVGVSTNKSKNENEVDAFNINRYLLGDNIDLFYRIFEQK